MQSPEAQPRWKEQASRVTDHVDEIRFPKQDLTQDHEWCEVVMDGQTRRFRFHDYHELYDIPGLYEQIFYEKLKCNSPVRVARLLRSVLKDFGQSPEQLRVLDLGAGNGMVGEELRDLGARAMVGVDIIDSAKSATLRDRPDIYDDYFVADFTDLDEGVEKKVRKMNLNTLSVVAALGFGDIPSQAFLKACDLIETPGWLAFNIKEDFIHQHDNSGFSQLIRDLSQREIIQIQAYRRYRHRLAITGKPLYYVAMVATKLKDIPDELMDD